MAGGAQERFGRRGKRSGGECLVMVFRPRLALALVEQDLGPEFTAGFACFRATTQGYLEAFYDRLYDSQSRFVGFEVTPVDDQQRLPALLSRLNYVTAVEGGRRIQVFIVGAARDGVRSTADQAFGGRVYQDESGQVALSVELDWLSESDLTAIENAGADQLSIVSAPQK